MNKLELWAPLKGAWVNQAWGIYNPAYLQFGFDHHNGIDLGYKPGTKLCAPLRMRIYDQQFYPNGGGNMVSTISMEKWVVPHLGPEEVFISMNFMHNARFLKNVGDVLEVGNEIAIPDNTGFSTGPHCHFGCYRTTASGAFMDTNNANNSFDPKLYFNGFAAEDKGLLTSLQLQVIKLLQKLRDQLQKKVVQ